MVQASKDTDFSDLSYGDETRADSAKIGLEHDYGAGGEYDVEPGQAVTLDGDGVMIKADDGDAVIGVLKNYVRGGDSGGPSDPAPVNPRAPATVKTEGPVKAEVSNDTDNTLDVSAGDTLGFDGTDGVAGVLDNSGGDTDFIAITDAVQDDRPDGTTAYYSEVLLR